MTFDKVIKGGMIVDGRNFPRYRADIGIRDGRIDTIGRISSTDGAEVIDASGLIVAPGFVDLHTHYDAQVFWDPYCTPVGLARRHLGGHRQLRLRLRPGPAGDARLPDVVADPGGGHPPGLHGAALPWTWETFPQWLDVLERQPKGLNMLTYVPLNPLLVHVMGYEAAKSRDATPEERAEMVRLLQEAMDAGACGWSAQRVGAGDGLRRPAGLRRHAVRHRPDVEGDGPGAGRGAGRLRPRLHPDADADRRPRPATSPTSRSWRRCRTAPSCSTPSAPMANMPDAHRFILGWIRNCQERGLPIYAQCVTSGARLHLHLRELEHVGRLPRLAGRHAGHAGRAAREVQGPGAPPGDDRPPADALPVRRDRDPPHPDASGSCRPRGPSCPTPPASWATTTWARC